MKTINGLRFSFNGELAYMKKVRMVKIFLDVDLTPEQVETISKAVDRERELISLQCKTPDQWILDIKASIADEKTQCWVGSVIWFHLSKSGNNDWKGFMDNWDDCSEYGEGRDNQELIDGLVRVGYSEYLAQEQSNEHRQFHLQKVSEEIGKVKVVEVT